MKRMLFLCLAIVTLSSCAPSSYLVKSGSSTLTDENIQKITPGLSKQEVVSILGEPMSKTSAPPLGEFWTYSYAEQKIQYAPVYKPFQPTQLSGVSKGVTVHFDLNGKVSQVSQSSVNPFQQTQVEFGK